MEVECQFESVTHQVHNRKETCVVAETRELILLRTECIPRAVSQRVKGPLYLERGAHHDAGLGSNLLPRI